MNRGAGPARVRLGPSREPSQPCPLAMATSSNRQPSAKAQLATLSGRPPTRSTGRRAGRRRWRGVMRSAATRRRSMRSRIWSPSTSAHQARASARIAIESDANDACGGKFRRLRCLRRSHRPQAAQRPASFSPWRRPSFQPGINARLRRPGSRRWIRRRAPGRAALASAPARARGLRRWRSARAPCARLRWGWSCRGVRRG